MRIFHKPVLAGLLVVALLIAGAALVAAAERKPSSPVHDKAN